MRRTGWNWAVLCGFAACLLSSGSAGAQTSGIEAPAGTLRLRAERLAADRFHFAERAAGTQNLVELGPLLETLRRDALIPTPEGAIAGTTAALELTARLPTAAAARLAEQQHAEAEAAWQQWQLTPQLEELQHYCRKYGHTPRGLSGWLRLALWLRDERQWTLSQVAWTAVAEHPQATPHWRSFARDRQREAQARLLGAADGTPAAQPTHSRPGAIAAWSHQQPLPAPLRTPWEHWLNDMRGHGALPFPAARPLLLDRHVYWRTPTGLQACDLQSGENLWQVGFDDWNWLERTPGYLESVNFRQAFLDQLGRHLVADTVQGRLSGDEARIYLVQDPRSSMERTATTGQWPVSASRELNREPDNQLAAYERATGKLAWRIGGTSAGPSYPLANQFFCGPPLVVDQTLYVVGQQASELQLLAIRADRGELLWKVVLGDLPRTIGQDPARQRIACTPVWLRGQILCPTASGALVAVDPLTRRIDWAWRYGVAARQSGNRARGENTTYLPDHWWEGWRELCLLHEADRLVLASPETDELHQWQISRHAARWSIPRRQGLFALSAGTAGIVICEPFAIRLHDWNSGQLLWRTEIEELAGAAVIAGDRVIVPTRSGRFPTLALADGALHSDHFAGRQQAPGELAGLVPAAHGWLTNSFEGLTYWPDLQVEAAQFAALRPTSETPPATRIAAAQHHLTNDRWSAGLEWLGTLDTQAAQTLRRDLLLGELSPSPARWRTVAADLLAYDSKEPNFDDVSATLAIAAAAGAAGDRDAAVQLLVEALARTPRYGRIPLEPPQRRVRPDLALAGALADQLRQDAADQPRTQNLLRELWQTARSASDPFSLATLADQWQPLTLTDDLLRSVDRAPFLGQSLLAVELRWLRAAEVLPADKLADIQLRLSSELRTAGFDTEAREYERLIASRAGRWDAAAHATAPPVKQHYAPWSGRKPAIERVRERNETVHYFPVPLDVDSSPFFDRLDVTIERQGRRVRFGGGGHPGTWEVHLPSSPSAFRYLQQHVAGWGRGRILVLRVGFELFGLAPVDERGEPAARVLWHLDTLGGGNVSSERLRLEVAPAIPGVRDDEYRVLDGFGQTVAQTGPVRHDFLCYVERGELVSVDLLTGLRRWSRQLLPAGALLGGDEESVLIWVPEQQLVQQIRAIDGLLLAEIPCDVSPDSVLRWSGSRVWYYRKHHDKRLLVCRDLTTQQDVWQRELLAQAAATAVDGVHLAVVNPTASLEIVHGLTGTVLAKLDVADIPARIERIMTSRDAHTWFLAISERVPQQAGLQMAQLRSGYRAPFVTGPLVAVDRDTLTVRWQRPLQAEPFASEQPKSPPVLMQVYKQPPEDLQAGQITDGIVRLIDKETGQLVFEHRSPDLVGYAAMSADAVSGVVHLALERDTFHLWYRPRPPAPALPD